MKKSKFLSAVMMSVCALPFGSFAQELPPSASTLLYDHSAWDDDQVLRLFSNAFDNNRNYPDKSEFETIGLTPIDYEFTRSHTRLRQIIKDKEKDVVQDEGFNHDRLLWCNLPGGYGKNDGGYPHAEFDQDVFSMWNYTSLFGSWNYGFLQAPGSWVDAAHKNGTRIYGGIKFFESWHDDGSEGNFHRFITTRNDGGQYSFKYSRAFVNAAAFFGCDGYNYNSEGNSWKESDFINFHAEVRRIARELQIEGFGIGQYTMNSSATTSMAVNELYGKNGEVIYDCMLNYNNNKLSYSSVASTLKAVEAQGLPVDNIFQGHWLVGLSTDYWTQMNSSDRQKMNIAIWGEHDQSRFFQFRVGEGPTNIQENYQLLLEKAFSGANRNPLNRPQISNDWGSFEVSGPEYLSDQLSKSPGFASMFPERTAIRGNLPFETFFSLGNGENYFYKGKVTHGVWYNMSQQDFVPTYRWLVTAKDNMKQYAKDIDVRFTHEDAYIGGSSIRLSGATTSGNDIVLYRTHLTVSDSDPKVTVALKRFVEGATKLSVIVKKENSDQWIEVPTKDLLTNGWEAQTLPLPGFKANDVIEYIGLRVNGPTDKDYKVLVGQIKISDNRSVQQARILKGSVVVEVKEENAASLSVKMCWEPDCSGYETSVDQFGMVYNDEINVDHFEVFVKESANGTVREVARTAQWAAYVGNIPLSQENQDAWIGVRSVSEDLKSMSAIEWVRIPRSNYNFPPVKQDDPYGRSWMSSPGNAGECKKINGQTPEEHCAAKIYVEKVTTTGAKTNISYQVSSNPLAGNSTEQYYFAEKYPLVIRQGDVVTLTYKGYESKGKDDDAESLDYDYVNAYIDYDGNFSFLDADEGLGKFGNSKVRTPEICNPGLSIKFTVPNNARLGSSRLRIVASDAWTPHPGPTGGTVKGYTIDFPVTIEGTNVEGQRGAAKTYKDYRDKGDAEQPENYDREVEADPSAPQPEPAEVSLTFPKDSYEVFVDEVFEAPAAICDVEGLTISYTSGNTDVATVDEHTGKVEILATGTTVITASTEATPQYLASTTSYTLTVKDRQKEDVTLTFPNKDYTVELGSDFDSPIASCDIEDLEIKYSSSEPEVATVDSHSGKVEILATGTTTISAVTAETTAYNSGYAAYTLTVTDPADGIYDVETGISNVTLKGDVALFANTEKAWFYDMSGRLVKFVPEVTETVYVGELSAGVYFVKMLNGQIIRSAKVTKD